MSKKHKIAWLEGDGIGKDVMEATKFVLDAVNFNGEYIPGDVGWEFWCKEGDPLPQRTIELLEETDACLFGAITSKPKEEAEKELVTELKGKGLVYSSPIVRARQHLDLFANMRPCKAYPGNPLNYKEGIDLVVFRENTEGLYGGVEFHPVPQELFDMLNKLHPRMKKFASTPPEDVALSTRIFTRKGCQRIARAGFEHAKKFKLPTVTIVEKPNVLRETSGLMVREARKIAKEYPGIDMWETNVDAMCMWLVKNPEDYSVLVATNMFGDIVSDLCAQLVGGLGFASSANLGEKHALFEPTHGSAPKYAGKYISNPIAMIITARLMLEYLGEQEKADKIENAIADVVKEGKVRTYDMEQRKADMQKDKGKTLEVAKAIAERTANY
jgi:3-isopropylmalate dehydrogenase